MLSAIRFSGATTNLQLDYTSPLPGTPSYLFAADSGVSISGTMTSLASHYETLLPVDSIERGNILITALDDSSHTFFFIIEFSKLNQGAGEVSRQMFSNDLKASLLLDSTSADRSVIITSSDYLIPLNGLNPGSAQLGKTVAIFHSNGPSLAQPAALSLSYNSEELASSPPPMNEEVRLHVHKWNGSVWEALGSWNDTAANIVSAPITSDGFYALFTTDISTATDESGDLGLPGKFEVSQNYPNPFNPTTTISFSVPSRTAITLEIFNVLGQKVRSLVDDIKAAGTYSIEWDGRNDIDQLVSTGVYLYRFRAGEVVQTRKMLLIK